MIIVPRAGVPFLILFVACGLSMFSCRSPKKGPTFDSLPSNQDGLAEGNIRSIVESFFKNYGALADGFDAFEVQQSRVLAPTIITYNRYQNREWTYRDREGYFQSI